MIEISDLRKDYFIDKKPFPALSEVTLTFPEVQFVAVLGPSGCGKTTLLNCIGGLDHITSGDIRIDGRSIKDMSEKELDSYRNNYVGFVFQNYYLIPQLTVLDNIKVALAVRDYSPKEIEEKALGALKTVGLENLKHKKPNQLSGGQAQRIAIARCLVTSPKVILADEPTGALDSENSQSIMKLLKNLSKDHLVILVTHNEELAKAYADRIIRLKDGRLISDETINNIEERIPEEKKLKKSRLSLGMKLKLALKNVLSRKGKTILTGIANSFGMIGIGFYLAINLGFRNYSNNLSSASATSLPVVVTAYNRKSSTEDFAEKNASVKYPDVDEIYPSVSLDSQYSYTYNNFSPKYLSYLNRLHDEGIVREYILSYGNDYSFNLVTDFPDSLDGTISGGRNLVSTTMTSYNYYAYAAQLPYNIFHVLYGDLSQYDLICGSLPSTENELVLVVNQYNAVNFSILKNLGFYNSSDTQEEVGDKTLSTKVKPIKFKDVLGKEYKVFTNDEMYTEDHISTITDALGNERKIQRYKQSELTDDFYKNNGLTLKIKGIIRPKSTSPFSILGPALCYLPSLQDDLVAKNQNSLLAKTLPDNLVFSRPSTLSDEEDTLTSFVDRIQEIADKYESSKSTVLPTNELNSVFSDYFNYHPFVDRGYYYMGYSTFLSDCRTHGASLVDASLLGKDLSDESVLEEQINAITAYARVKDYDEAYRYMISLIAYANAYSQINSIVIFPYGLPSRSTLVEKLDEFNEIQEEDDNHASSEEEKVYYVSADANEMLEEVGQMISLVSMILIIFAVVSLVVSGSMTGLLTSNNVLERKKEIGLLRSLGSRKSDVVSLFEIEAFLVGTLAGIIGSILTYSLSFPINALINHYYSYYAVGRICCFTWYHALIVIAFSILIGLLSSLIPAIKASRENPVDALRSE